MARWRCQASHTSVVRPGTTPSGAWNGSHRVEADDYRRTWIEGQLIADFAAAEELAEEPALTCRKTDEDASAVDVDGRHVVLGAVDPEPTPELVHRHVRPALDEAAELGRGASGRRSRGVVAVRRRIGPLLVDVTRPGVGVA